MKKYAFISFVICFSLVLSMGVSAKTVTCDEDIKDLNAPIECSAVDLSLGADLKIAAKSAVLMEPYSGEILYEQNSAEKLKPASITKIMSLLLIMEAIDRRELTPEEVVTASKYAASMGGSQIWLKEGESMTVDDLLKATVVASANDAMVALAEKVAGSEEAFVKLMNEKAKALGMNNTVFKNCTGLDTEGHLTTALDVAVMSCELIKHPLIKRYSTLWIENIRDGKSELVNTNKLVRFYKGTTGLKTGTTSGAGYCLSACAERDGTEFVAVIMGGNTSNDRFEGAKKLLDFGFANYVTAKISANGKERERFVKIKDGTQKYIKAVADSEIKALIRKQDKDKTVKKVVMEDNIKAPVRKGERLGTVEVYASNEKIGEIPLVAEKSVEKIKFSTTAFWIIKGLFKL